MFKNLSKYYLYIVFVFYFIVNIPILDNLPFGLDYEYFITATNHIPNPIYSWFPWSSFYKSWSLTYTVLWVYIKTVGESVVFLRFLNLLLHFLIYLLARKLAYKLINKRTRSEIEFVSLLVLFNPLSILTIAWTFQIKTLLATAIFLFMLLVVEKDFKKSKKLISIPFLFWLSINAKIQPVLYPFVFAFSKIKNLNGQSKKIITIVLFILAGCYGLLNIKGVTFFAKEARHLQNNLFEDLNDDKIRTSEFIAESLIYGENKNINFNINVLGEVQRSSQKYLSSFSSLSKLKDKHIITIKNLGKLTTSSLGLSPIYLPFYEDNTKAIKGASVYVYSFLGLLLLFIIYQTQNKLLFIALTLFLPISGYFYVPYMKYSLSSDHWYYPAMIFLILGIFQVVKKPLFWNIVLVFSFGNYLSTIYNYKDFKSLLKKGYAENQNRVNLETLLYYTQLERDHSSSFQLSKFLLDTANFTDSNNYKVFKRAAIAQEKPKEILNYFGRFTSKLIKNENELNLDSFLQDHSNLASDRMITLIKALTSVNKNTISKELYQSTVIYLDEKEDQVLKSSLNK